MATIEESVPAREYARVKTHLYGRIETLKARAERAETALIELVELHHRTITGSKLHDPENQSWAQCACKTCLAVAELLPEKAEDARHAEALKAEVFGRPECVWRYCPDPDGCQEACAHPQKAA